MSSRLKLILTILLGLILRALILVRYGDFWDDELFSFVYSQKPWLQAIHYWVWETNPPLHMFLLKLWFFIIPVSETAARIPSLIFGVLTIVVLYRFVKRLFDERTALFSSFFLALAPYHIFISATNRGYALLLLLTTISADLFSKIFLEHNFKRAALYWYIVVNILLLYTHLTAVSALLSQLVVLAVMRRAEIFRWIQVNLFVGIAWLPWLIPSALVKLNAKTANDAWFLNLLQSPTQIIVSLQPLVTVLNMWPYTLTLIILFLTGIGFTVYRQSKNKNVDTSFIFILILGLFPIIIAACMNVLQIKFFVIALPCISVLIAYLLITHLNHPLLIAGALLILTIPGYLAVYQTLPLQKWSTVNNYFTSRYSFGENKILLYNNFSYKNSLDKYFTSLIPTLAYRLDDNDLNYDIITQNYLRTVHSDAEVDTWVRAHDIAKYQEVFLLKDTGMRIELDAALERAGYHQAEPVYQPRLMGSQLLYHYVKNK